MAREVSIDELAVAVAAGQTVLDVRENWEYEAGHVPTAKHIPLNTIPDRLSEISRTDQVWIICQAGGRSMTAANYLEAQGYNVVSVAGGTGAWIQSGKEVVEGAN
jgi:rhodanese-related sulfurtransferase